MSEIEKHNPIPVDSSATARPATEHDTGKAEAANWGEASKAGASGSGNGKGNGAANGNGGERDDDIRGRPGVAAIKVEYLLNPESGPSDSRDDADADADDAAEGRDADSRSAKRQRTDEKGGHVDGRDRNRDGDKKKNRGQNKNRPVPTTREPGPKLCRAWEMGQCTREKCNFQHSWAGYFEEKPVDLVWAEGYVSEEPYVRFPVPRPIGGGGDVGGDGDNVIKVQGGEGSKEGAGKAGAAGAKTDIVARTIDLGARCPVLQDLGYCPFGWRCRFAGAHVDLLSSLPEGGLVPLSSTSSGGAAKEAEADPDPRIAGDFYITAPLTDPSPSPKPGFKMGETNWPSSSLLTALRTDKYDFPFSRRYLRQVEPDKKYTLSRNYKPPRNAPAATGAAGAAGAGAGAGGEVDEEAMLNAMMAGDTDTPGTGAKEGGEGEKGVVHGQSESMDVPLRPEEKKRLDWRDELYLAPLTTVGNLPFRRLCASLGATITASEMALAQPLISGQNDEWALCRRHASERTFGIQLAGGYPNRMVPAAEVIARELGHNDGSGRGVDFVDVNLGCPIDLVFNQGAGSALMDSPGRLGKILIGMNRALGERDALRQYLIGKHGDVAEDSQLMISPAYSQICVASGKPNAHKLVPRFATEWGASSLTLHGRSRQQRYSKLANWEYIKQCVETLHAASDEANMPRVPMFGNGDCYSAQQYWEAKEASGVDGVLVARGALIKPWLFTEIKERREWDISATERLDIVKQFAEFGLSHWGSDHLGVSTTRRFLCEYLSFTHRYIPIGLLERMPPQMNERPPPFKGRSELETLLASGDSRDWVKISEMFLGPVPKQGWGWVPKHKSNAYGGEEAQG